MSKHKIINFTEFEYYARNFNLINILDFENGKLLITYNEEKNNEFNEDFDPPKVSVIIASAITAYSRIIMTSYIMDNKNIIHSIDTDGIKLSGTLNNKYIGRELGLMDHEGTYSDATFIAPKIYGLFNKNSLPIIKVKGLKNPISY